MRGSEMLLNADSPRSRLDLVYSTVLISVHAEVIRAHSGSFDLRNATPALQGRSASLEHPLPLFGLSQSLAVV